MLRLREAFVWLREISLDPVGGLGVLLTTLGALLFLTFYFLSVLGFPFSPYAGIFIFIVLPAVFLVGLVLLPIARFRLAKRHPSGRLPVFDFENPRHLRRLGLFSAMTVVNVCIFGFAAYGGYHYSEKNEFCGLVCHQVMKPEYTAYQESPHSRVHCVECHIGTGADWFVRSKLSGVRQVFAVATGDYRRPIPTPIEDLRPARETCEQCHWPEKFHGEKLEVIRRYKPDEQNTELTTVLVLKVGGGTLHGEPIGGIHWHTNSANKVSYVSTEESREEIPWVRLERADGTVVDYYSEDPEELQELLATRPVRVMDCMDCHNRPSHEFDLPDEALDRALAEGRLDPGIPFLRREAYAALTEDVPAGADVRATMLERLRARYAADPDLGERVTAEQIDATAAELARLHQRNVFPEMGVGWGTYPVFQGHKDDGGCFRCHDGSHESADGQVISDDCETCHTLIAWDEVDPPILSTLSQ